MRTDDRRFDVRGDTGLLMEGARAFFIGEGYEVVGSSDRALVLEKRASLWSKFSSQIEKLPTTVEFKLGELRASRDDEAEARSAWVRYAVAAPWRIITRVDRLFFRLEAEALEEYLETGRRRDTLTRFARVRRPVKSAVIVNVVVASSLVAGAASLAGFDFGLMLLVALLVSAINFISIVGFADILIEAMEDI